MVFAPFWSAGIDFHHFDLESDKNYEGTTVVYECIRRSKSN